MYSSNLSYHLACFKRSYLYDLEEGQAGMKTDVD